MPTHIHEKTEILSQARLVSGRPEDGKVVFEYWKNDATKLATHTVDVPGEESTVGVEDKYEAPLVADDEESYLLNVKVLVNNKELSHEDYEVWPLNGTLESVDEADASMPLCPFKVKQGATLYDTKSTRVDGKSRPFSLEVGKGFKIEVLPPFEVVEHLVDKGRNRKVRVTQKFVTEILAPAQLAKHYVNLPSATNGQDGKGNRVRIVLGVRGDDAKPQDEQIGGTKIACYIEVKFLPAPGATLVSKRNTPLRKTHDEGSTGMGDLTDEVEIDRGKHYKAKVYFGSEVDGRNVGIFEIELGYAGGDKCELKVGSTPACADATLTFETWRRVYYELVTIDFMALTDFPAGVTSHLLEAGKKIFVEYTLDRMVTVPKATAEQYTVFRREFMGKVGGPADVYVIKPGFDMTVFGKAEQPREVCFALADYVCDEASGGTKTIRPIAPAMTVEVTVDLGDTLLWLPDRNDADGNLEIKWVAQVTKDQAKRLATLNIVEVDDDSQDKEKERVITITDGVHPLPITYKKPFIGDIPSEMSSDWKDLITTFLRGDWGDYPRLVANGNQVNLTISGARTSKNALKRFNAARAALETAFNHLELGLSDHPAIDASGEPLKGDLNADVVDFAKSTKSKVVLNLPVVSPTDPGNLVGPLSNTKCPLRLELEFKAYEAIGGYSRPGTLEGAVAREGKPDLILAEVVLHEIGHKMAMTLTGANAAKTAPGLTPPKQVSQGGAAYPMNGTNGHVYTAHGHQGPHCAYGLSDTEKGDITYNTSVLEPKATCVMFGVVDQRDGSTRKFFCEECVEHLRARDLRDLTI